MPGRFFQLDTRDAERLNNLVEEERVTHIVHLSAVLTALAEEDLQKAHAVVSTGALNALEAARRNGCLIYIPSTIAVFGKHAPLHDTPVDVIL